MESGKTEAELHGDLTEDQAFEELAKYWILYPERQPGDLDIEQVGERFKCHPETARVKMNALVKRGLFERVAVSEDGKKVTVYRRVK